MCVLVVIMFCGGVEASTLLNYFPELLAVGLPHRYLFLPDRYPVFIDTGDFVLVNDVGTVYP